MERKKENDMKKNENVVGEDEEEIGKRKKDQMTENIETLQK